VKIIFLPQGWADYLHWQDTDRKTLDRINALIQDAARSPFKGVGKPEPLKAIGAAGGRGGSPANIGLSIVVPVRAMTSGWRSSSAAFIIRPSAGISPFILPRARMSVTFPLAARTANQGEDLMEWMLMPLRRYADFNGRSRRKEYWMFVLGLLIVYLALGMLVSVGAASTPMGMEQGMAWSPVAMLGMGLIFLVAFAVIIPAIAVQVRRFHDQDKSGWFVLLNLVPYVGGIIVLVFMCLEGTKGDNRYGPDPKAGEV
jgi:uncharacterized membrane protein YhaH (DUF805 family)